MRRLVYAGAAALALLVGVPAWAGNDNGNCGVGKGNGGSTECGGGGSSTTIDNTSSSAAGSSSTSKADAAAIAGANATGGTGVGIGKGGNAAAIGKGGDGGSAVALGKGGKGGKGGAGGAGGEGGSSSASGGAVDGSGNSAQGQQQKQRQSATASNSGVRASNANQTTVDARNQSRTNNVAIGDIDPIGGADSQYRCAMVRGGGFGVADGAIASGSFRWDTADRACQTNLRAVLVSELAGGDAGLLYLAQTDPAVCAVLEYRGIGQCQQSTARKNMKTPSDNNVARNLKNTRDRGTKATPVPPPAQVCRVKPGTRTVVTNWSDQMACARSLGVTR